MCTGIRVRAGSNLVFGRTMEWQTIPTYVITVPKGTEMQGYVDSKIQGYKWKSKYGMGGIFFDDPHNSEEAYVALDIVNEVGLMGSCFFHPGFCDAPVYNAKNKQNSISAEQVPAYLCSLAADCSELKSILANVECVKQANKWLRLAESPVHFIFVDLSGKALVLEFSGGKVKWFDNPHGVITNSPKFDFMKELANMYLGISAEEYAPEVLDYGKAEGSVTLARTGAGSKTSTIPGGFTPQDRFIRAISLTKLNEQQRAVTKFPLTTETAIHETFRIMGFFDRIDLGVTSYTTAFDMNNKILHWKTNKDMRIKSFNIMDALKKDKPVKIRLDTYTKPVMFGIDVLDEKNGFLLKN